MVTCMTKPHHLRDKVEKCARLLIDHGAQVNASDRYHMTPLLYASQTGSTALAQLLISANADVNAKEVRGWTVSGDVINNYCIFDDSEFGDTMGPGKTQF